MTMSTKLQSKKKVAFLFGAGAEGEGNYNLKSGLGFMKSALNSENKDAILNAIQKVFRTDKNCQFSPYKYVIDNLLLIRRTLFIRALQDASFFRNYYSDIRLFLNEDDMRLLRKKHPNIPIRKKGSVYRKDKIISQFNQTIVHHNKNGNKKHFKIIKDLFNETDSDGVDPYYCISLGPILDAHFHSFIDPKKYSKVYYSRVFNYYWFCYFGMIEDLIINTESPSLSGYHKKTKVGDELDYEKIIRESYEFTNKLYNAYYHKEDSYYSELRSYLDNHDSHFSLSGCITTNYFDFIKRDLVGDRDHIRISNINGKLNLFEYPEMNCVVDHCEESFEHRVFFPFIFGQSTIKPIVHPLQIKEYAECSSILNDAQLLVILGYGINEDDNHLNAYITDFLHKKKKVYIANPNIQEDSIRKLLRVDENIKDYLIFVPLEKGSTNKMNVEKIFSEIARS